MLLSSFDFSYFGTRATRIFNTASYKTEVCGAFVVIFRLYAFGEPARDMTGEIDFADLMRLIPVGFGVKSKLIVERRNGPVFCKCFFATSVE